MPEAEPLRSDDPSVIGRYRLIGRLGMGGQGVVYLGSGPDGVKVAVKVLREEIAADPRVRDRFAKEIAAARRVDPFCIAPVREASLEGPRPFVVTEYVEGPSLQQAGPRDGTAAVHRLAVATATALAAIHEAGIVHRDFKPSNVLLGSDGPRVIDFGIARDTAASPTVTSSVIGTPAYMAPEQFAGGHIGPPADVFAWAAVVVYAATGRPPFGADTFPAIMHRVLNGEPDLGDLEEPLRSIVISCMAKDPAQRPTMQNVLLRLLSTRSAPTPQPPPPPVVTIGGRQPDPARRRLMIIAGAGAAIAAAAIATAAVILLPVISQADSPDGGHAGSDAGRFGANTPADPSDGTIPSPSPGSPSSDKSGKASKSGTTAKPSPGASRTPSSGASSSKRSTPTSTRSSGSTAKLVLTVTGTKKGSCYTNPIKYSWEDHYADDWNQITVDGTITSTGGSPGGSSSGNHFSTGTHVIKIRPVEPYSPKSVTFTIC